jgi:hypothetical protein
VALQKESDMSYNTEDFGKISLPGHRLVDGSTDQPSCIDFDFFSDEIPVTFNLYGLSNIIKDIQLHFISGTYDF